MNSPINPEDFDKARQLHTKATILMYDGDFLDAIATLDESLQLNPISLFAFQLRAICRSYLCTQGNISIEERKQHYQNIISDLDCAMKFATIHLRSLDSLVE